ncbi:NADH-quinone oxidoreductase subunit L [Amphibiibacter pelophylacis]|uniref:NADH-quinone oxidoreductase subunit L n=1 Tax=Amphibiibacter pelophylacis TaxID=1799477 RepID=A0ACC6P0I8_9BURK
MDHAQLSPGLLLFVALAPLAGAILAGFFGKTLGRTTSHRITILGVALSFLASAYVFKQVAFAGASFNGTIYEWMKVGGITMEVGFQVDSLTAMMMCVVTFVSLMVHIYTIGYMEEDDGYQRFFAYISLFTFSMLMLVMSNNLLQLFFGWEAVGLVSYLLIGFWYKKETAIFANLKAFLVNRVGDFGFILGIGLLVYATGSLNYSEIFAQKDKLATLIFPGTEWMLLTVACLCLFVGAMGKSAQFPLHVWLPDSMEGPTPISALIHAATMVTAGIFMVSRMSPLFELSDTALSFMMIIGAITALFMGFLGVIQNDIKRVVAYSTLSQLGYMTVALGASAYPVAVFHLMTHAFFKALLFLGAGSVIIGMHHNQDMRYMGGLRKYMPITWITSLVGSLALIGVPFLSGFYSKDSIIEAVHLSTLPGSGFASFAVTASVFVTALYSFRMYFLVFHGEERYHLAPHDDHHHNDHGHGHAAKPHESPWVVTLPLVLLAIPSVLIGFMTISGMLYSDFFKGVISIDAARHPALATLAEEFHGPVAMALHSVTTLPFWLTLAGVGVAYWFYMLQPSIPKAIYNNFRWLHTLLDNKYYLDAFNEKVLAAGARGIGRAFWKGGDAALIDGVLVNGSARTVGLFSLLVQQAQNGRLYRYAWVMSLAVLVLLTWQLWPYL